MDHSAKAGPGTATRSPPIWRRWAGLIRSWWIYRRPGRARGLKKLYRPFVFPGALVFDVGAHLGDRSRVFRKLGARVVAVEPQPALIRWLARQHAHDPDVVVEPHALGAVPGQAMLALSGGHPAVASLAPAWCQAVRASHPGFARVRWDGQVAVSVTTLDALIARHGKPDFCKIDVEGFEAEVLAGLSTPLAGLSVEFVQGALDSAVSCIERLQQLGCYQFNVAAGESRDLLWTGWRDGAATQAWLTAGADRIGSGDLYARLLHFDHDKPLGRSDLA